MKPVLLGVVLALLLMVAAMFGGVDLDRAEALDREAACNGKTCECYARESRRLPYPATRLACWDHHKDDAKILKECYEVAKDILSAWVVDPCLAERLKCLAVGGPGPSG